MARCTVKEHSIMSSCPSKERFTNIQSWFKIIGIFNRFKVVSIFQVPDRDVNSQRSVGSAAVDADQNPQIYGGLGGNKVVESPR